MKKGLTLVTLAMVAALALALVGCNGSSNQSSASSNSSASVNQVSEKSSSEESVENKLVSVALGDSVSTADYDLTFNEAYWVQPDEDGFVTLAEVDGIPHKMQFEKDKWIFLLKTSVTNNGKNALGSNAFYGEATINGEYNYPTSIYVDSSDFNVQPLDTAGVTFIIVVSNAAKDKFEKGEINLVVDPSIDTRTMIRSLDGYDTVYSFTFA